MAEIFRGDDSGEEFDGFTLEDVEKAGSNYIGNLLELDDVLEDVQMLICQIYRQIRPENRKAKVATTMLY